MTSVWLRICGKTWKLLFNNASIQSDRVWAILTRRKQKNITIQMCKAKRDIFQKTCSWIAAKCRFTKNWSRGEYLCTQHTSAFLFNYKNILHVQTVNILCKKHIQFLVVTPQNVEEFKRGEYVCKTLYGEREWEGNGEEKLNDRKLGLSEWGRKRERKSKKNEEWQGETHRDWHSPRLVFDTAHVPFG